MALAACSSTQPARFVERDVRGNMSPTEATVTNAGADHCDVAPHEDVASIEIGAEFAIGFGDQGGLLAWSTQAGVRVRPLSLEGKPRGAETIVAGVNISKPIQIAPLGVGFVLITKRIEYADRLCESRCLDAACVGLPPGVAQPQVCFQRCEKPCKSPATQTLFIQYINLAGQTVGVPSVWSTGLGDIEAVLPGDGKSLGMLLGSEILWVHTDAHAGIATTHRALPSMQYALLVRGIGTPTLLALSEEGSVRLIEERGDQMLKGSLVDPRSGRILDARLQARRDPQGRIHIAKQAWVESLDSIQYSVIENGELPSLGQIERGGFREPFAEYVEPHFDIGHFYRSSWIQQTIGQGIELREHDSDASVRDARVVWTGKTFLFTYSTQGVNPPVLRTIVVDCSGKAAQGA
jgi:hypothetical protein